MKRQVPTDILHRRLLDEKRIEGGRSLRYERTGGKIFYQEMRLQRWQ